MAFHYRRQPPLVPLVPLVYNVNPCKSLLKLTAYLLQMVTGKPQVSSSPWAYAPCGKKMLLMSWCSTLARSETRMATRLRNRTKGAFEVEMAGNSLKTQ